MRELIALRAKIDLMQKDCTEERDKCDDLVEWMCLAARCSAYEDICDMIDDMVGKQLEDMYEKHIQEANGQTD